FLSEMINRTKHSITIVLPDLMMMPENVLLDAPTSILIHLFADFDHEKLKDTIIKILSKPNIRLWRLTNHKLYYGALRDSEEMMVAPASIKNQEIVGFVSEQEGNIKLFRNVIGPAFYYNAREIRITNSENKQNPDLILAT
ncbi:MAG: phospholipase D-like domain-containing protein, partial [Candidatus Helarchaeales archaeon]